LAVIDEHLAKLDRVVFAEKPARIRSGAASADDKRAY
jgi:hypothetical protein